MPVPTSHPRRPRVLVICGAPVSERLTGVAIRAVELARVLARHADVTVAGAAPSALGDLPTISYRPFGDLRASGLVDAIERADFVIAQPPWPHLARLLRRSRARLIYDLYDPEPFEVIERLRPRRAALRRLAYTLTIDRVLDGLGSADHVICASEKQRDLWLGAMLAERLLTVDAYDADQALRSRLDTVPFGLPDAPAVATGAGPRDVFEGIVADDEVVLWNGGIWAWLDAASTIRAVALLCLRRPRLRLVFMGSSSLPAAVRAQHEARELARELGLLDSHVFFNETWVDYERRADWLLASSCVISTQVDHLETRFAFRTRMLDALWARRPIVCTSGDDLARLVEREDLGAVVPPLAPEAIAAALDRVLERGPAEFEPRLSAVAVRFTWSQVAAPILRWMLEPQGHDSTTARIARGRPLQLARGIGFECALRLLNVLGIDRLPSV